MVFNKKEAMKEKAKMNYKLHKEKHFMVEDNNPMKDTFGRQIKKDNFDSPNENYLESRSIAGEGNKSGCMPVGTIPLNSVDNQSAENELTNNEVKDGI